MYICYYPGIHCEGYVTINSSLVCHYGVIGTQVKALAKNTQFSQHLMCTLYPPLDQMFCN